MMLDCRISSYRIIIVISRMLTELRNELDMRRQSVTQHLGLLEDANLLAVQRQGREKLHYINPVPIHEAYERWIRKHEKTASKL